MIGAIFPVASNGGVHVGIVGMANIAFRFEQYRANVLSAPNPTITADPRNHVSKSISLSNHQNSIPDPALNQMAVLMNWSLHRQKIVWSQHHMVNMKLNQ
jgi:hypothetical protein